jgi:hypothetical protein
MKKRPDKLPSRFFRYLSRFIQRTFIGWFNIYVKQWCPNKEENLKSIIFSLDLSPIVKRDIVL